MDYEQKYNKALEWARKRHNSVYQPVKEELEEIFPELTESEDERIRKELIEHIKDQITSFISAPDCRDKYEEEELAKYNKWIAWLEKQKEQKPAEWSDTNELVFQDICKHLNEEGFGGWVVLLEALKNGEFNNPNAEWSEEDEEMLQSLILFIDRYNYFAGKDARVVIKWLKSLSPQPKQE